MKKLLFTVVIACGMTQFVRAEQVENWFSGNAAATPTGGAWSDPLPTGVTVESGKFVLEMDEGSLDFTTEKAVAPDTNVLTRIVSEALFLPSTVTLVAPSDAKTALTVNSGKYYAYDGSAWVELAGATPDASAAVTVLAEVDYKTTPALARYAIMGGDTPTYLYKAEGQKSGDWLELAATPADGLVAAVAFAGDGEVTSVNGKVQLGVASYAGVKYPTVQEAVNAAEVSGQTGTPKVDILRDNNETVETTTTIEIDTHGKSSGTVVPTGDAGVAIDMPPAGTAAGSGVIAIDTIKVGAIDPAKIEIRLSDTSKEVCDKNIVNGYVVATVRTSAEVMNDVVFDNNTRLADPSSTDYRAFLLKNCNDPSGAYMKANTTAAEIIAQLNAAGGNELPLWQSFVLGIEPTKNLVTQPTGTDKDGGNFHLAIPAVSPPESGFDVSYKVMNGDTQVGSSFTDPADITIPVGSGTYAIKAVLTPKAAK